MSKDTTYRRVFINNLRLDIFIGIYDFEKEAPQAVQISMDIFVPETALDLDENIDNVVCYERLVNNIKEIALKGHINLVETLGERIAQMGLKEPRVSHLTVKIEKMDIFPEAQSVGIEITRYNKLPL
jgi:dihydroneopterin aldolase